MYSGKTHAEALLGDFHVWVQLPSGKAVHVRGEPNVTISTVKERIARNRYLKFFRVELRFVLGDRDLDDSSTLDDYGIVSGDTIELYSYFTLLETVLAEDEELGRPMREMNESKRSIEEESRRLDAMNLDVQAALAAKKVARYRRLLARLLREEAALAAAMRDPSGYAGLVALFLNPLDELVERAPDWLLDRMEDSSVVILNREQARKAVTDYQRAAVLQLGIFRRKIDT